MQHSQVQMRYASLGLRFAAIVIDTVVLFSALVALLLIAAAAGVLELPDPATTSPFSSDIVIPSWIYVATYSMLFGYYALLEAFTGGSLGKLALGLRVRMDDGREPTTAAIVVRNLLRIPEVLFWYIPAGVSCLISKRNKRLGDFAAGTVVVHRDAALAFDRGAGSLAQVPPARRDAAALEVASPATLGPPAELDLAGVLAQFKAAVFATRGAHDTYLHFSEIELARETTMGDDVTREYSAEYVAAWYSLSEAVHAMNEARATAAAACARSGTDLDAALEPQRDLAYLLRQLPPYLEPGAGEHLHDAYMRVVRGEAGS